MKNENNEALALLFGALLVVGAALWSAAAIIAPAAIIKLCWLFLMG
ncbi:hypothetical protein [Intestinimonas butyriciproducens]|uniref:Uncharacterized protein n=1 Tax=Intestinimonas butyriciproducens TaxID=1297617 RepID=A0A2U1CFD4_9FIRM|nr:hypothetical protein [Intestinimonas butyriciproducens]MCR1904941.1 hypothetical protein [Intestinimonas butyriciproducens]PVY59615.1 hypothetical protein C7373_101129 [Intestinimonas butyriciproducens]QBB64777.1 hypothetical protein SRB521_00513 [Intestinimonas butyriciproducens]